MLIPLLTTQQHDIKRAIKFRNKHFLSAQNMRHNIAQDEDEFDHSFEHLLLLEPRTDEIVACCRLAFSKKVDHFYNEKEFDLTNFLKLPGAKLEMSRLCVHSKFRQSRAIFSVWQAVIEYAKYLETAFIFGCVNINSPSTQQCDELRKTLRELGAFDDSLNVKPRPGYDLPKFTASTSLRWPSIFRAYFKMGVRFVDAPAFDHTMNTLDFFTYVSTERL